jgi:nucleotide-binding universal stress UspA family protein
VDARDFAPRQTKLTIVNAEVSMFMHDDAAGFRALWKDAMIKDVMVCLDGSPADELRLTAVADIVRLFESQVVGLFLNPIPSLVPVEADVGGVALVADLMQRAREAGDRTETSLAKRLARLNAPVEIRRFDVLADDVANIASREARSADAFVALRPNGSQDPERLVEGVLFDSGRHILLVPEEERAKTSFDRILIAWNGSRESARAVAEAMPYLYKAQEVLLVVVGDDRPTEQRATLGTDAVRHLKHHGVDAALHRVKAREGDVGARLMAEAVRHKADLIVMGGYGHSRLREWILGGVTYNLMHEAAVRLLMAH